MLRDYNLIGAESQLSIDTGLADAQWYQSPIDKKKLQELLKRNDWPAVRDSLIWFGLIFFSGYLVTFFWGSWLAVVPYIAYSALYASTSDSRWHESGHGTAFKSEWMNNVLYEISSFMVFRQSVVWRWSHARHHSDTIIRGRDPEISMPRPPKIRNILRGFIGLRGPVKELSKLLMHIAGRIHPDVATFVPDFEHKRIIFIARIYGTIYLSIIILSIYCESIIPFMLIGAPTFLGAWLMPIYGMTQHAGLQENVLDHRLNTRTVYMNWLNRFLYWNMNYHIEHHMFPMVPYHALPKLHELVKNDCPKPYESILAAYREIIPTLLTQRKNPDYNVPRFLPPKFSDPETRSQSIVFSSDAEMDVEGKIEVCGLEQIHLGEVVRFDHNQSTYAICRTKAGDLFATEGMCTHGNSHLADGFIIGNSIECAKHNGRFSLIDGLPTRIPACEALKTFEVKINDGKVALYLFDSVANKSIKSQEKRFRVISNNNVATFIKELKLEPLDSEDLLFQPGQYVKVIIPPHDISLSKIEIDLPFTQDWERVRGFGYRSKNEIYLRRNYSIASNPSRDRTIKFNVRMAFVAHGDTLNFGIGSSYIFNLKTNDEIKLIGPYGNFLVRENGREKIFIGKGAGMAPLRSHISHLFETLKTRAKVGFWYGAHSVGDIFYSDYFRALEAENSNFSFHVSVSRPPHNVGYSGSVGSVCDVLLREYLARHDDPDGIDYYLCGSPAMIAESIKMLAKLDVSRDSILHEEF